MQQNKYHSRRRFHKHVSTFHLHVLLLIVGVQAYAQSQTRIDATPTTASVAATSTNSTSLKEQSSGTGYIIVHNDVLWLKVYQESDLETKSRVSRDGLITLPLLGPVSVAGLTVDQAADKIRRELDRRFLVNPQIDLTVSEYAKRKFTIMGQVGRPGIYEYSGEERMTLLQAIGLAGGLTRLAAPSKTTLQRLEGGEYKNYKVDPDALGKSSNLTQFYLQHEDVITIGTRIF